jgi:hypothetical protein
LLLVTRDFSLVSILLAARLLKPLEQTGFRAMPVAIPANTQRLPPILVVFPLAEV